MLAGGAEQPRDLAVEGRDLDGVHFAMDFLPQQNRRVSGEPLGDVEPILATGKRVVVIGGGDTGSDCIGTSTRQGAASITQLEILPRPPDREDKGLTWPEWPLKMRTSSSQEEGAERDFAVLTKRATGRNGKVEALDCVRVEWVKDASGRMAMQEVPGSAFELKADLVLLAMGFLGPEQPGMLDDLGVELTDRGNVARDDLYRTSVDGVWACGDMGRGQSLIVWAIAEGRACAADVDRALTGSTALPEPIPASKMALHA